MYKFSEAPVAEFYGRYFYSISNEEGQVVAFSEKIFQIPDEVRLLGNGMTLIFEKAIIWGGVIWGGEIRGGVIETTLLQIQGTRHFCYATPNPENGEIDLGIGCHIYSIEKWLAEYEAIGIREDYTSEEIAEYGEYIRLFAARYSKAPAKKKPRRKTATVE